MEKIFSLLRMFFKKTYYKLKYGKRLKIGKDVHFRKGLIINISKNGQVEIGDKTFFNNCCSINCHNKIVIGKNNLFGEGVKIYGHNHAFNNKGVDIKKTFKTGEITIGDRNWFGSGVIILSKAKINDRNVFGAGMIVNDTFGSDEIVTEDRKYKTSKIIYKG